MGIKDFFKKRAASKQGEAGKEDKVLFKKRAASKQGEAGKEGKVLFDEKKRAASKQGEAGKEKNIEVKKEKSKPEKGKKMGEPWRVLKSPHVTEKAGLLAGKNYYAFKIFDRTNKKEVKKAIEHLFGVEAVDVKIINVHSKKRRLGKIKGRKPGYKKAIVKIKKGQKIEILPR